eukprot:3245551-Pleurochrysis_carterae.AAC.1
MHAQTLESHTSTHACTLVHEPRVYAVALRGQSSLSHAYSSYCCKNKLLPAVGNTQVVPQAKSGVATGLNTTHKFNQESRK